jgi:hypothetical protein
MNILQQIASSIGTATFSVVLTNQLEGHKLAGKAIASRTDPKLGAQLGHAGVHTGLQQAADSFATTFTIGVVLTALCLIPAFLLPRRKPAAPEVTEAAAEAVVLA